MAQTLSKTLAEFGRQIRYEDLPPETVHQAKRAVLDFIGVALAGSRIGMAPITTPLIAAMGGVEEATVIGDGRRLPAMQAAFLNAVSGHTLDMDDGQRYANGHPGVGVIPPVLALAERDGLTGREVIEAVVLGYEAFLRLGRAINPSHLNRGFHTTATAGAFSAAAASAKILKLSVEQTAHALALAGLQSAGLLEVTTSGQLGKHFQVGKAAQNGVLAALVAEKGGEGPEEIFEGAKGFLSAYTDLDDYGGLWGELGRPYQIMTIYFKRHAACRHIHAALDAIEEIQRRHALNPAEITDIELEIYTIAQKIAGQNTKTASAIAAKFSLPVSAALMLVYGRNDGEVYSHECIENPLVQDLAAKVSLRIDPKRDAVYPAERGASVTITAGGQKYSHGFVLPKGDPENPLSDGELAEKFEKNAGVILAGEKAALLRRKLFDLEKHPLREVMAELRP